MWCKLTSRISAENVDALLERAEVVVASSDNTDSMHWAAKEFFEGEQCNHDLLRLLHMDIWREITDTVAFDVPVIDHAALLIKGASASGTALHQDRPYWIGRDAQPTIFSVWIALEDMSRERGGLMLFRENEIGVGEMSSFNSGTVLEHDEVADPLGDFPITITDSVASRMAHSMAFVPLAKGEAVAFDSFEPHMSGPNTSLTPRLAMKIAYAEGKEKQRYLTRTETLERGP